MEPLNLNKFDPDDARSVIDSRIFYEMLTTHGLYSDTDFSSPHFLKDSSRQIASDIETALECLSRGADPTETIAGIKSALLITERELMIIGAEARSIGLNTYTRVKEELQGIGSDKSPIYRLNVVFQGAIPEFRWLRRGRNTETKWITMRTKPLRKMALKVVEDSPERLKLALVRNTSLVTYKRFDLRTFSHGTTLEQRAVAEAEEKLAVLRRRVEALKSVRQGLFSYARLLRAERSL